MTLFQALALALLQGVSELFPVSSLGHTILVPALLHWQNIERSSPSFLAFVVVLHLGTALALIVFYRAQWYAIVRALARSVARGRLSEDRDERIGWRLVVGTIPGRNSRRHLRGAGPPALRIACSGRALPGRQRLSNVCRRSAAASSARHEPPERQANRGA